MARAFGRPGHASGTYPERGNGGFQSPFGRVSLSAPAPFSDGVPGQVPFDVIDLTSANFGDLIVGGVLSQAGAYQMLNPGLYLVTVTVALDVAATDWSLDLTNGDGSELIAFETFANVATGNATGNFLLLVAPSAQDAISCILSVAGSSGNIVTATMLVTQISSI